MGEAAAFGKIQRALTVLSNSAIGDDQRGRVIARIADDGFTDLDTARKLHEAAETYFNNGCLRKDRIRLHAAIRACRAETNNHAA